jgi:hypothetical protein
MMACLGGTETMDLEANPEEESEEVHREVLKEHAAVKHVGGLRKQHRGWNLAAECHQKSKERTWRNCGSQKKLAAAGKKLDQGQHGT